MQKTKVLILGATGFIGRNLIERLSTREDVELFGTYLSREPDSRLSNENVILSQVDLTNSDQVNRIISGMDVVIQAAAVTTGSKDVVSKPYIHVTDNAVMNSLILRACFESAVKHMVFFSCTVMYPSQLEAVKEDDVDYQIIDKYFGIGWTKVYIEKMCEFYSKISDTKFTVIRHSNIYGPHDKYDLERSHVFGATVTKVLKAQNNEIEVWGDGSETRDLLYISDLVDFVESIIKLQECPYELINIGYGHSIPIKSLIEKIIEVSGKQISMTFDVSKPTINFNLALNCDKVRAKYGWSPQISLEDGIKKTLTWYRQNMTK